MMIISADDKLIIVLLLFFLFFVVVFFFQKMGFVISSKLSLKETILQETIMKSISKPSFWETSNCGLLNLPIEC